MRSSVRQSAQMPIVGMLHKQPKQAPNSCRSRGKTLADKSLVIACGALANEIFAIKAMNDWDHFDVQCLDAKLHNRPSLIAPKLEEVINARGKDYKHILIGYADCGSSGDIDALVNSDARLERLKGPHCFSFFLGEVEFETLSDETPGTFWLTDFLVRHFDSMVIKNLGLDTHPELRDVYFGNYTDLIYLSQRHDESLINAAEVCAEQLGLSFRHIHTGFGTFEQALTIKEIA